MYSMLIKLCQNLILRNNSKREIRYFNNLKINVIFPLINVIILINLSVLLKKITLIAY